MYYQAALISDTGKTRQNNEDNYYFFGTNREDVSLGSSVMESSGPTDMTAAAVYDGMGGETAGEIASLMASRIISPCRLEDFQTLPMKQLMKADEAVCDEMEKRGGASMGSTLTALYMDKDRAICVNLGDSRCYLFRKGQLTRLTTDQSEAQGFIDEGSITEDEARDKKSWHVLTHFLGMYLPLGGAEHSLSNIIDMQPGDIFLLCTDGLSDMVSDPAIRSILSVPATPMEMARDLVDTALFAGGRDNVTVITIRIHE